jgi:dipeptidyl aminopeptidase/acylaminoacyl peptidase
VIPAETDPALVEAYFTAVADPAFLRRVSPIYHLDRIQAPMQIHSGAADGDLLPYTPPAWAAKLATALDEAEKEVAFFNYEGEGHYFGDESWRLMMERSLDFFDRELGS